MLVLIISSLADPHARAVMAAVAARGDATVELLDLSAFPTRIGLSMAFEAGSRRLWLQRWGGGRTDLSQVGAVWWRRPQPFTLPSDLTNPTYRRFALSEAATAFQGLYQSLHAFWINDPGRDAAAGHKAWQLAVAQETGLAVPPTLITNDPDAAREFWLEHEDEVIQKPLKGLPELPRHARRLHPEGARRDEALRVTPVIFQRRVEAVADVRVIAIGPEFYAAAADVRGVREPIDIRLNLHARWEAHALSPAVAGRLRAMMRRLGLEYGAFDLRLTPEGRYVFLEVNPVGEFLFVEAVAGYPLTATLAAHLVNGGRANR